MTMHEHPLRRQVVGEMHLRRWPSIKAPSIIIQTLRLVDDELRAKERQALASMPFCGGISAQRGAKHIMGRSTSNEAIVIWEQHSEASSLTYFLPVSNEAVLVNPESDLTIANFIDWSDTLPGQVVRATQICVVPDLGTAESVGAQIDLTRTDMVSCYIGSGPTRARIWSDFRVASHGYGRLLVAANGMADGDLSRSVQRLQELCNYRNLALLGLPVAQANLSSLNRIEHSLSLLASDVVRRDGDDAVLEQVSALSLDLMSIATSGSYRMSATAAYAQLAEERLAQLDPIPIEGFPSLPDFTQRRLLPAVRTCASHVQRTTDLSERADRFVSLLRTRIETRIESQTAQLLASLDRSAALQLQLHGLVEGFSVLALSYYGMGLLAYVLDGLKVLNGSASTLTATAILTPFVVFSMWAMVHRQKGRLMHNRAN